jgi:hypothetical protein
LGRVGWVGWDLGFCGAGGAVVTCEELRESREACAMWCVG